MARLHGRIIAIVVLVITSPVWFPFLWGVAQWTAWPGHMDNPRPLSELREYDTQLQYSLQHWWQYGLTRNQTRESVAKLIDLSYNMGLMLGMAAAMVIVVAACGTTVWSGVTGIVQRASSMRQATHPDQYWGKQSPV